MGWPRSQALMPYVLSRGLEVGAHEDGIDHYFNIDLDGDDVEDTLSVGCSASIVPADPCVLESQLSTGGKIDFEAWHLYLIRHHGRIYAVTADAKGAHRAIFRVGPKQVRSVCAAT